MQKAVSVWSGAAFFLNTHVDRADGGVPDGLARLRGMVKQAKMR